MIDIRTVQRVLYAIAKEHGIPPDRVHVERCGYGFVWNFDADTNSDWYKIWVEMKHAVEKLKNDSESTWVD